MPIYKHRQLNSLLRNYGFGILQSVRRSLIKHVSLGLNCNQRLKAMSHTNHRKGFLAVRYLLNLQTFRPTTFHYTNNGKPYLEHGPHISFSHTK